MNATRTLLVLFVILLSIGAISSFYIVDSGNVAVEKTMGTVELDEVDPGLNWKLPFLTKVYEFS